MATQRQDIAKLADAWHPDVEWYSRAVGALMRLPISDRRSWRYLAAIHGIDLNPGGWRSRGLIRPTEQLPPQAEQNEMWDQCQHEGWFFLPWHRGYLAYFEEIVAWAIGELGGPPDWKLPYWNYLDASNPAARNFPRAFVEPFLPDGSTNALAWWARSTTLSLNTALAGGDISLDALTMKTFTGNPGASALGGSQTGFEQFGPDGSGGALELDPHNTIHVMIGGLGGFMGDPNYAALDPLFWLHHCNIDRLWSAWLGQSGNIQENGAPWSNGPTPRQFKMPRPNGTLEVFTPADCLPGARLDRSYDDLVAGTGLLAAPALPASIGSLPGAAVPAKLSSAPIPSPRVLGSSQHAMVVGAEGRTALVPLAGGMPASAQPQRYYALLENIRGEAPSSALSVYVGLAAPGDPSGGPPVLAKTVTLFGLAKASSSGPHAGGGLSVSVDITDPVRALAVASGASPAQLAVTIRQPNAMSIGEVTVGKVSILALP